jgi:hypothetical protein
VGYQHDVFDTDSNVFFRDVDAWLDREYHALLELQRNSACIMNINSDEMA